MSTPVANGHTIKTESESSWQLQKIEWQQSFSNKNGEYYRAVFQNLNPNTEQDLFVFIQKEKLDQFKQKATKDGDSYKITVDGDFVYGQAKGGKKRWLVFHDKSRNPYQHRFIQGMVQQGGSKLLDRLDLGEYKDKLAAYVGDSLRTF